MWENHARPCTNNLLIPLGENVGYKSLKITQNERVEFSWSSASNDHKKHLSVWPKPEVITLSNK